MAERISAAGEAGLLAAIRGRLGGPRPGVLVPTGDDAAAFRVPKGRVLVASQDDMVEGTHFRRAWSSPEGLAMRLLAVNLSDLAAMGAVSPLGCLISTALPKSLPRAWFDAFLAGVARGSKKWGLAVLGGNISRAPRVFLSMSVFGTADPRRLVRRSGARPGQVLAGVGPLGEAAAGLDLLKRGSSAGAAWARPLVSAFLAPRPLLAEGRAVSRWATSMMDDSDGLAASARTLGKESCVGFRIAIEAPASPALRRWARERRKDLERARLAGGEDYGLVFTVRERDWPRVKRAVPAAYRLGRAVRRRSGDLLEEGFGHFQ